MGWFQLYCKNCGWELEPNAACAIRKGCPDCRKRWSLYIRVKPQQDP